MRAPTAMPNPEKIARAGLWLMLAALLGALLWACPLHAERIKDLASVQGVRANQLIGYGLVVGLDGSGDQTTQTPRSEEHTSELQSL